MPRRAIREHVCAATRMALLVQNPNCSPVCGRDSFGGDNILDPLRDVLFHFARVGYDVIINSVFRSRWKHDEMQDIYSRKLAISVGGANSPWKLCRSVDPLGEPAPRATR